MNFWHDITEWYAEKYLHQPKYTNEIATAALDQSTVSENRERNPALPLRRPIRNLLSICDILIVSFCHFNPLELLDQAEGMTRILLRGFSV